jgi:YD repeat-containing protein
MNISRNDSRSCRGQVKTRNNNRSAFYFYQLLFGLIVVTIFPKYMSAQDYITATGAPTFTTAKPVELGYTDLSSGNLHMEIPILSIPGRGKIPFTASLVYDSHIWEIVHTGGTTYVWQPTNIPNSQGGWRLVTSADVGSLSVIGYSYDCGDGYWTDDGFYISAGHYYTDVGTIFWTDPHGTIRGFGVGMVMDPYNCVGGNQAGAGFASDGTGYYMNADPVAGYKIQDRNGNQVYPVVEDANGNYYTVSGSTWTDTLGRPVLTKSVSGGTTTYTYKDTSGTSRNVVVATTSISPNTDFSLSGVTEFTSGSMTVVSSITIPDVNTSGSNLTYQFAYDTLSTYKYGDLTQVTLPTGGVVQYGYTVFADAYGGKNRWISSRTRGSSTWTYTPSVVSTCSTGGVNCSQTVTYHPPDGNESLYSFNMNNGAWNSGLINYSGSAYSGTIFGTSQMTYDLTNACPTDGCIGAGFVALTNATTTIPTSSSASIQKQTTYSYDNANYRNTTAVKEWDFISTGSSFGSTPNRETDYAFSTSSSYINANMISLPLTQTVYGNGSLVSQIAYAYDGSSLTSTSSSVVQHDYANYGTTNNIRGNLTSIQTCSDASTIASCSSGHKFTTSATYNDTGTLNSITDPRTNNTSFSYINNFYDTDCISSSTVTGAFPTTVTNALSQNTTTKYYSCTGQIQSVTDLNSQTTSYTYDLMLRPYSVTNPDGGVTQTFYYTHMSNNVFEALTM